MPVATEGLEIKLGKVLYGENRRLAPLLRGRNPLNLRAGGRRPVGNSTDEKVLVSETQADGGRSLELRALQRGGKRGLMDFKV